MPGPNARCTTIVKMDAGKVGTPMGLLLALTFSQDQDQPFDRLYVGGTGDVAIQPINGDPVTFKAVPVGTTLNVAGRRVLETNTTATLMVGIKD